MIVFFILDLQKEWKQNYLVGLSLEVLCMIKTNLKPSYNLVSRAGYEFLFWYHFSPGLNFEAQ